MSVIDRDPVRQRLCLDRKPRTAELLLRPNTYQLQKQREAVQALQNAPHPQHRPLLNLFQSHEHVRWPEPERIQLDEHEWCLLRAPAPGAALRPGTEAQRQFVSMALASRDWGILEGPPGSGKTTTICELILQELRRGHRVLICASTHVAVDNVIEKLMDPHQPFQNEVIPVRIGDRKNISETVKPWQIDSLRKTEREGLLRWLKSQPLPTRAQQTLYEALQRPGNEIIDRIILDSANVVCGTTIGILQHPDIRAGSRSEHLGRTPIFDVLILDEASKTTFQEFLVPALLARKWILVGDPRQLSPYVEEEHLAANLDAAVPKVVVRDAALDTFDVNAFLHAPLLGEHGERGAVVVVTEDPLVRDSYRFEAMSRKVPLVDLDGGQTVSPWDLLTAGVVVGSEGAILRHEHQLPLDVAVLRGGGPALSGLRRRIQFRHDGEDARSWGGEIAWRLTRAYEKRQLEGSGPGIGSSERLPHGLEDLLPSEAALDLAFTKPLSGQSRSDEVRESIQRVQRVALPSILESLWSGFGRHKKQRSGTALSDGLPPAARDSRHVLLEFQHRMHPDISSFPRKHIYRGHALVDPPDMAERRAWREPLWPGRMQWINVACRVDGTRNEFESNALERQLKRFLEWTRVHAHPEKRAWEVAVLTFYRAQERLLRSMLRRLTAQPKGFQHFSIGGREQARVVINLCTVDRFQGHEADLVLLSFARTKGIGFLDSPNRLNVALTRARYQTLLVGKQEHFASQKRSELLRQLAALDSTHDIQE
ncbi:AAA domain-containing protein [Corallococcus sp. M7]